MGIINHELAFDLENLKKLRNHTKIVCKSLCEQHDNFKKGLDQLRKDWNTDAGRYFFKQVDTDWESNIKKFENTLMIFEEVLTDAIEQFEMVLEKAKSIKIDLPRYYSLKSK